MAFDAKHPFKKYRAYLRVSKSSKNKGRKIIGLYSPSRSPKRITMSYARYLLCVKEGRMLKKREQVDHRDGDKTNDDIDNLQILSVKGNRRKCINDNGINRMMVELRCPSCRQNFVKKKSSTFLAKGGFYSTCKRKCAYKMLTLSAGLTQKELIAIGKTQIIRLFRAERYRDIK